MHSRNDILRVLAEKRKKLKISQSRLAQLAGVSLPFIQLMEAGRANPSLRILEACMTALGIKMSLVPAEPDWQELSNMGVPLGVSKLHSWDLSSSTEILDAYQFVQDRKDLSKEREALEAFLVALKDHYPKLFFRDFSSLEGRLPKYLTGKHIKLRRISLSHLGSLGL